MKKFLLIFSVLFVCLFVFFGCGKTPIDDGSETDPETTQRADVEEDEVENETDEVQESTSEVEDESDDEEQESTSKVEDESDDDIEVPVQVTNSEIKLKQYAWDGHGYSTKTIPEGKLTKAIIDELAKMPETGVLVEGISDKTLDEYFDSYEEASLLDAGTMWLEVASQIYRLSPALSEGCHVADHLGEGYVISLTDEFRSLVSDAWQYYPYNYYTGEYISATGYLTLKRAFVADSTVEFGIKNIQIQEGRDATNKITLGLTSTIRQEVDVRLDCRRSEDDLGDGDGKKVYLSAGKEEEVELTFSGWDNSSFRIYITVDNTRLELEINTYNKNKGDYKQSAITISQNNGGESINPLRVFSDTTEYRSQWYVASYANGLGYRQLFADENFDISNLPTIVAADALTVTAPEDLSFAGGWFVYDLEGNPYKYDNASRSVTHLLPPGEYVVSFFESTDSRDTDPSAETYWWTRYSDVFRVIVPERAVEGETYHSLSFNKTDRLHPDFDLNATYREGERVEILLEGVDGQYYRVFINGEKISMLSSDTLYWMVFAFFMPDEDVYVEIEEVDVDVPEAPKREYRYSDITIGVKNSSEAIKPVQALAWQTEYDKNGEEILNACGAGCYQIFDDPYFKVANLPTVVATDELVATVPQASTIVYIELFNLDCQVYSEYYQIEISELHLLPAGEYIVSVYQIADGSVINADAETYYKYGYDDVFHLIVPEAQN